MKIALIVGGSLVGLLVVYKLAQASGVVPISTGTGAGTSLVPGSSGGGTAQGYVATPPPSTSITNSTIGGVKVSTIGKVVAAPVYYPTLAVVDSVKWVGGLF